MNKLIIHGFFGVLVLGLLAIQLSQKDISSLSSNVLSGMQNEAGICTKPEKFSTPDESAWCSKGFVKNIEENRHTWNWSCLVNETEYRCHFTEDISYSSMTPRILKKS